MQDFAYDPRGWGAMMGVVPPHGGPLPPGAPRPPVPPVPPVPFEGFGRGVYPAGLAGTPKVRRGDVRAAALALLAERPRNGYQIIQEITERSQGIWRPSPGSVYPALQQLEDEGLVRAEEDGGRRVHHLTADGARYVAEHRTELAEPWTAVADSVTEAQVDLRSLLGQVTMAMKQVVQVGTPPQHDRAREVLAGARRALYRILADGDEAAVLVLPASGETDMEEDA